MTDKDRIETILTALDSALEMADTLLQSGHLLSIRGKRQAKNDIAELRDFAEYQKQKLNEEK